MKLGLQITLAILSLIPVAFGLLGLVQGTGRFLDDGAIVAGLDNQYRYNSGTYVLVSLLLWYAIPKVEQHFKLLSAVCAALFIGGVGRVISHMTVGPGQPEQFAGMFLELGAPLFLVWQQLVARASGRAGVP